MNTPWPSPPSPPPMPLRDYFAAAALSGVIAAFPKESWSRTCEIAYDAADAMLAARATSPSESSAKSAVQSSQ